MPKRGIRRYPMTDSESRELRETMDTLRVFSDMAGGAMFGRLRAKLRIWGTSWRTDLYTDAENIARLQRAVEHLIAAVDIARREDAPASAMGEPWKRAADVANQAFMLADPLRKSR